MSSPWTQLDPQSTSLAEVVRAGQVEPAAYAEIESKSYSYQETKKFLVLAFWSVWKLKPGAPLVAIILYVQDVSVTAT